MASSLRRTAPLILPAAGRHTATVIFVHGLGDTGHGWASAVDHWRSRNHLNEVKFVLPHAPHIPISVNGGMQMPGWFDLVSTDEPRCAPQLPTVLTRRAPHQKTLGTTLEQARMQAPNDDAPGILASRAYLHSLVQDEVSNGIPSERVVLGGFSQGGAISIFAGLTAPFKLAGIIGLSSWLLLGPGFRDHVPSGDINKSTPVLMGQGDEDPLVRYEWANETQKMLSAWGYDVTLKTYRGMGHSACLEELDEVEAFLASRLPAQG
ncbi:hypothetical protein S7711_06941 [Stachybotrys chartarum IBT 7711]|uniref:Acyl-protein thioesterase 1 n=1 Tax=Stachybotrys chartarum (strain CBS 109288 / IBT 7711) TaxID=1280523 RepID=A0A084AL55_STACB|nr:hypothetical protein S7711_06941 [Stachybotrys chartarum IBT 7711]KFA51415.1 hypothetical protein S40293_03218 [Stachybotrys chartarum IBT 40293]KFA74930.1 hypothetical protein S40288_06791 [Stachybotrys chartarum IBT 40288]